MMNEGCDDGFLFGWAIKNGWKSPQDVADVAHDWDVTVAHLHKCIREQAEEIARLRAALNGTHFHHKAFEPECAHCQAALKDVTDGH